MKSGGFPSQLIPVAILFGVAVIGLVVFQQLMIPESFGKLGHYRAASIQENARQPLAYAGSQICVECHDDIGEKIAVSDHQGVGCEACHGPAQAHVDGMDDFVPDIPSSKELCPICHSYNPSRPSGFPQILNEQHHFGEDCLDCHDAHNPAAEKTLDSCAACHRVISRQKRTSRHASLDCSTCHTAPSDHARNPIVAQVRKPQSRSFCGGCHRTDADSPKRIPRISIDEHYPRYLCWDCHYPHRPEAL